MPTITNHTLKEINEDPTFLAADKIVFSIQVLMAFEDLHNENVLLKTVDINTINIQKTIGDNGNVSYEVIINGEKATPVYSFNHGVSQETNLQDLALLFEQTILQAAKNDHKLNTEQFTIARIMRNLDQRELVEKENPKYDVISAAEAKMNGAVYDVPRTLIQDVSIYKLYSASDAIKHLKYLYENGAIDDSKLDISTPMPQLAIQAREEQAGIKNEEAFLNSDQYKREVENVDKMFDEML